MEQKINEEMLLAHSLWTKNKREGKQIKLQGTDLRRADLRGADLSGAGLRKAYLRGADLSGANLCRADLRRADLSGAYLSGANLREADLSGADLSEADLRSTLLNHTGIVRIFTSYECTIYPDGRISYGCETHTKEAWEQILKEVCDQHEPNRSDAFQKEIKAILALAEVRTTL